MFLVPEAPVNEESEFGAATSIILEFFIAAQVALGMTTGMFEDANTKDAVVPAVVTSSIVRPLEKGKVKLEEAPTGKSNIVRDGGKTSETKAKRTSAGHAQITYARFARRPISAVW